MSSSLTCARFTLLTFIGVIVQIIGLSLFVFGFFPVKPAIVGESGAESFRVPTCNSDGNESWSDLPPEQLKALYQDLSEYPPPFDRLILMVIDGLPAEFLLGKDDHPPDKALMEAMPYTQSLLASGMAIGYHAKAAPPTVTMPRLKAMVSGAIGGFLDVAFNFNTQALLDDNLLVQFLRLGWKMVMLGDETWLKLFPGLFTRYDGVSSFFVKDTVQVDRNVTRHLDLELRRGDWDLLILHYLGLDHVGHIGGRKSVFMGPKLTEMDEIIKTIHTNIILNEENEKHTLLVVVSDHGMTDNGNHGGSSFEETDALVLLAGLRNHVPRHALKMHNKVSQVDIVPTLALLFGVPIPKNNIGIMIPETVDFFTGYERLRALQLNSWQLLRLLQAQLPGLPCKNFPCYGFHDDQGSKLGSVEKFCRSYLDAAALHSAWISKEISRSNSREDYHSIVAAYYEFLKTASEWLSHKATDKPTKLLACGVASLLLSCLILFNIVYRLHKEFYPKENQHLYQLSYGMRTWHLDEIFSISVIVFLVISMGSSSLVEEEQYIWHFLTSTFNSLLLQKTVGGSWGKISCSTTCSVFVLLISGRILRGWHQGGINWIYLPDISKWLEKAGSNVMRLIQLTSGILTISISLLTLSLSGTRRKIIIVIGFSFLLSGLLVLHHIIEYQIDMFQSSGYAANLSAQMIYATLSVTTIGTVLAVPWIIPLASKTCSSDEIYISDSVPADIQNKLPLLEIKDASYIIGWTYIVSWSLLQLLLQKPVNSMPTSILLVQIMAILLYSSQGLIQKQWVEVAILFYTGMAGHFSMGNSNSLATIDVAAAFIGISNYSAVLSGILMFIITYASPMLLLLSMVIYISVKNTDYIVSSLNEDSAQLLKMILAFPCLIPLVLNSVLLTAYTIVLLLMRNHLFVWSVFSPKYLYVCTTTICVYIGVCIVASTISYLYAVLVMRKNRQHSSGKGHEMKGQ